MTRTLTDATVGQLAAERPDSMRVFEKFGIDYCCGGDATLIDACREHDIDPEPVLRELNDLRTTESPDQTNWTTAPLSDLADNIEHVHHAYLKTEMPRLDDLARKVVTAHGDRHPELFEVKRIVHRLKAELESHILREELVLFPLCRRIDHTVGRPDWLYGSIQNPISVMSHEHQEVGDQLARLRRLTNNYQPPEDACNSYSALYEGLAALDVDMHKHVHKENNILFPRVIAAEARLASRSN